MVPRDTVLTTSLPVVSHEGPTGLFCHCDMSSQERKVAHYIPHMDLKTKQDFPREIMGYLYPMGLFTSSSMPVQLASSPTASSTLPSF